MRLRSLLFVPGDRPDRMHKALAADADALILDLEDSVSAARKPQARIDVAAFLDRPRSMPLLVRVNPLHSGLTDMDLEAISNGHAAAVVLPKAEGAQSVRDLLQRMQNRGLGSTPVLPLVTETAAAMFHLRDYSEVAERLAGITWGAEDLSAAVGAATAREPDGRYTAPFEMARTLALFAAHAAGVPAIETVYPAFRDLDGLARYASRGARDGFTGMLAIHPSQVPAINAAFTPAAELIERARRIVAEFERHPGAGVLDVDGRMVDAPHLKHALGLLARADPGPATGGIAMSGPPRAEQSALAGAERSTLAGAEHSALAGAERSALAGAEQGAPWRGLSPTTIADCLPRRQIMDPAIRPMWPQIPKVAGPAYTVRCAPGDNLMLHAAIYRAPRGAVVVVQGADAEHALAGGNVCAVAQRHGIAGFVLDGAVRDVAEIRAAAFPVFARAVVPKPGTKTALGALQEAVVCGGVRVEPGDIIVGDEEGIVVVPHGERDAVLAAARERAAADAAQTLDAWEQDHRRRIETALAAKGFRGP